MSNSGVLFDNDIKYFYQRLTRNEIVNVFALAFEIIDTIKKEGCYKGMINGQLMYIEMED